MSNFDSIDFQPNSVGVMVVRVIRLQDIVKALRCSDAFALEVVREIRGETSSDGETAFVLPSQLAAWAYRRAGKPLDALPYRTVLVKDADHTGDALKRAASRAEGQRLAAPPSGETPLKEIRSDLRRLKSAMVQPGAVAVTIEQAAARLGCAKTRIFELLKSGELKRGKKVGRSTMVTLASIDALTAEPGPRSRRAPRTPRFKTGAALKAEVLKLL